MTTATIDPKTTQRMDALERGNVRRREMTNVRQQLRSGELDLRTVMLDPPDLIAHLPIIDAVRISRCVSTKRSPAWVQRMGRAAVRDGVNLMMPLGKASTRTREWVAEYADWRRPHSRRAAPRVSEAMGHAA